MEILALWLLLSVGAGILANRYNRNPVGWTFLAILLSPLVGFVFLLAAGPRTSGPDLRSDADLTPSNPPNQGSAGSYSAHAVPPYLRAVNSRHNHVR